MKIHDDYFRSILEMSRIPKSLPHPQPTIEEPTPLEVATDAIQSQHDLLDVMGIYYKEQRRRRKQNP